MHVSAIKNSQYFKLFFGKYYKSDSDALVTVLKLNRKRSVA